jgi:hypothetical protein
MPSGVNAGELVMCPVGPLIKRNATFPASAVRCACTPYLKEWKMEVEKERGREKERKREREKYHSVRQCVRLCKHA